MKTKFNSWASTIFCGIILLWFVSCKKDNPTPTVPVPEMEYFDLGNTIIRAGFKGFSIDVNLMEEKILLLQPC